MRPANGILFGGAPTLPEQVAAATRAERSGFDSVWVAEPRLTRDGLTAAAAIAAATRRVRVGTAILNVFTRGAALMAVSFASLEELAPGRVVMGLGAGSPNVLAAQGFAFERPLTRLREYCEVIPRLLAGERVSYSGSAVRLDGARIDDALSRGSTASRRIPLYLAATGPRALELAGELADGVLLNTCLSPEYAATRLELIERGAHRSGRTLEDLEICMSVVCSPHGEADQGLDAARRFVALYLAAMPNVARETGVPAQRIAAVREAYERSGLPAAARLVDDETVDRLTAAGSPAHCRHRLEQYRAAGVDRCLLRPVDGALESVIDAVGP